MFKRRGRILFLDAGTGTRALMARAWAVELGGAWVAPEAAAQVPGRPDPALEGVMAEAGVAVVADPCPLWASARETPRDLVVPLDVGTGEDWALLLGDIRAKPWELGGVCPAGDSGLTGADLRACRDGLRQRVAGLVGGFRMKAREDDKAGTMADDGESD